MKRSIIIKVRDFSSVFATVLFLTSLKDVRAYHGGSVVRNLLQKDINMNSSISNLTNTLSHGHAPSVLIKYRTCFKEVPAVLLFERHFQNPEGNGSSIYFAKISVCCDGYKPYENDKKRCVPDCGEKCRNGVCLTPGVCKCYPGFVRSLDDECVQTCPLSCLNGKCHSNGTCICERGFTVDRTGKLCQPICTGGCRDNQNCTAPDYCTCFDGFKMNNFADCEFYCSKDCVHGKCIGPNLCECYPEYHLKDGICQTNCTQKCDHGTCVSVNRCRCNPGYTYDHHTTTCLPECKKCVNGVCIAPGCCKCYKNFLKVRGVCTHKRKIKSD